MTITPAQAAEASAICDRILEICAKASADLELAKTLLTQEAAELAAALGRCPKCSVDVVRNLPDQCMDKGCPMKVPPADHWRGNAAPDAFQIAMARKKS